MQTHDKLKLHLEDIESTLAAMQHYSNNIALLSLFFKFEFDERSLDEDHGNAGSDSNRSLISVKDFTQIPNFLKISCRRSNSLSSAWYLARN